MKAGDEFPPVTLYGTSTKAWVGDGWHRIAAARMNGADSIEADLKRGGRQNAVRYALKANAMHGAKRTKADERVVAKHVREMNATDATDATKPTIGKPGATRGRKLPAEVLTADEVLALIAACSRRSASGIRGRALIATMWRTGARVSEALALMPKDLDRAGASLRILHGKGNLARTVGIDMQAVALIDRWLDKRRDLGIGTSPIFCTLSGTALSSAYVRAWLKRIAKRAGIEKRCNPHSLRHTHAAQLCAEGIPLNVIQAQLGHSNGATTSRYLQHIAPVQVTETMRARRWSMDGKPTEKPAAAAPTPEEFAAVLRWIREHESERTGSPQRDDQVPARVSGTGKRRAR